MKSGFTSGPSTVLNIRFKQAVRVFFSPGRTRTRKTWTGSSVSPPEVRLDSAPGPLDFVSVLLVRVRKAETNQNQQREAQAAGRVWPGAHQTLGAGIRSSCPDLFLTSGKRSAGLRLVTRSAGDKLGCSVRQSSPPSAGLRR